MALNYYYCLYFPAKSEGEIKPQHWGSKGLGLWSRGEREHREVSREVEGRCSRAGGAHQETCCTSSKVKHQAVLPALAAHSSRERTNAPAEQVCSSGAAETQHVNNHHTLITTSVFMTLPSLRIISVAKSRDILPLKEYHLAGRGHNLLKLKEVYNKAFFFVF